MDKAYELHRNRLDRKQAYDKGEWQKPRVFSVWNGMLLLSYVMVGLGIWGLFMIFGPVARVEAAYQAKKLVSWAERVEGENLGWLVPNFSFDLIEDETIREYGIVIPTLFIQEKVVMNVDPTDKQAYLPALKEGIAHAAGTAGPGQEGLGYYFAHSSGLDAPLHGGRAVFYLLGKLEQGDEVRIYKHRERFTYRVVGKEVVEAEDLSFLRQENSEERIVLQTCWPVGTSSKRLLVTAERV